MEETCTVFDRLFTEKPWFLDSVYWLTTEICLEFPTLRMGEISIVWDEQHANAHPLVPDLYVYKEDISAINQKKGDKKDIYIRIAQNEDLKALYLKVHFNRNFDEKAFCYFAKAICRFYNKINKDKLAKEKFQFDDTVKEAIQRLDGKNFKEFFGIDNPYIMPRALRARYTFATNVAYFDFIIDGGSGKDPKRTFFRDLLSMLEKRSFETYEGEYHPFACIIDTKVRCLNNSQKNGYDQIKLLDYLKRKESNIFSNGYDTYFVVSGDGIIMEYVTGHLNKNRRFAQQMDKEIFAPKQFLSLAEKCKDEMIGVVLSGCGDILVFKKQSLVLSKLKSKWHYHDQATITEAIKGEIVSMGVPKQDARLFTSRIYASVIDASFAHSGGCLGIIKEQDIIGDVVFDESKVQTTCQDPASKTILNAIMKRVKKKFPFGKLNRQVRAELLSLDGANILSPHGNYMAVGYILNQTLLSEGGGGREAAARKLGDMGLGIKISEDGEVKMFSKWRNESDVTHIKIFD